MITTLTDEQAIRAAQALKAAADALEAYREITKDMRLGDYGAGRAAYSDLGAFAIMVDYEADGQVENAVLAFANALKAGVDFEAGDAEYRYDKDRDDVYDFLTEAGLYTDDEDEEDES